jgi:hypothetical protein
MTNFCVKSNIILGVLAKKILFTCSKKLYLWLEETKKNFPLSFDAVVGSGIRDG